MLGNFVVLFSAKKGSHIVLDYRSIERPSLFMLYEDQVLKACEH